MFLNTGDQNHVDTDHGASSALEPEAGLVAVYLSAKKPFPNEVAVATQYAKPAAFVIGLTSDEKYWEVAVSPGILKTFAPGNPKTNAIQGYKLYEEPDRNKFLQSAAKKILDGGGIQLASYFKSRSAALEVPMAWAILLHTFILISNKAMRSRLQERILSVNNTIDLHCISLLHTILKHTGGKWCKELAKSIDKEVPYWMNVLFCSLAHKNTQDLSNHEYACIEHMALFTQENRDDKSEISILQSSYILPPQELVRK
ncbi:hypothetical protein CT0861_05066 [Colletotrichum tofieldiae]|uniref:Uncharacterized protein n=1 Tax=Colletotrichum tofieldiae TaxID=708197 RepID=A0A166MD75_9PEZI|nr:hypothetical protein CT0861_05066 [Colletotrichum tofieldiae]